MVWFQIILCQVVFMVSCNCKELGRFTSQLSLNSGTCRKGTFSPKNSATVPHNATSRDMVDMVVVPHTVQ